MKPMATAASAAAEHGRGSFTLDRTGLVLLCVSSAVAFLAGEIVIRFATPETADAVNLIYSSPPVELDRFGAVRHPPNEDVRYVMVYGDDSIEFDTTYHSNNLGLIDHEDYRASGVDRPPERYAFVGDSFAAGMGAQPWVPELRDRLRASKRDIDIYNLGVPGTGFLHFQRLLTSLTSQGLTFTHIVLIVISNDFYRPFWVPAPPAGTSKRMRSCLEGRDDGCVETQSIVTGGYDDAPEEILRHAREVTQGASPQWWRRVLRRSQLLQSVWKGSRQLHAVTNGSASGLENPALLDDNLQALSMIRSMFANLPIHLVHLPQKEEVVNGGYHVDIRRRVEQLGLGIEYFPALAECAWSVDMYYPRDNHPNARGYANMALCVSEYLFARR